MSPYRNALPQLDGGLFATDGGLETTLIYHDGLDLPCFAAFMLMRDERGVATLRRYFERYMKVADTYGARHGPRKPDVAREQRLGFAPRL